MKNTCRWALGLLVVAAFCSLQAVADSQVRIVRLSYVDGDVEIDRAAGEGFERAVTNMPVVEGARVQTSENGRTEVEFEDGSTVRLAPETIVSFEKLALRDDGGKRTVIAIEQGLAYFDLKRDDEDEVLVAFGGREFEVTKSSDFRVKVTDNRAELAVMKGTLELESATGRVRVKKNETIALDVANSANYDIDAGIPNEAYDDWNEERDQYASAHAATTRYSDSPYSYGWNDLNSYGVWIYDARWGHVWRPYDVAFDWDPFYAGHWVYYPRGGYVWVSPYQWGWLPYRYGRWCYISGYGWAWQPGRWRNWHSVPVIYGSPRGYARPRIPVVKMRNPTIPVNVHPGTPVIRTETPHNRPRPGWRSGESPNGRRPLSTKGDVRAPATDERPRSPRGRDVEDWGDSSARRETPHATGGSGAAPVPSGNGAPVRSGGDMPGRTVGPSTRGDSRHVESMRTVPRNTPPVVTPRAEAPRSTPPPRTEMPRPTPPPRAEMPRPMSPQIPARTEQYRPAPMPAPRAEAPRPQMSAPRMEAPRTMAPPSHPSGGGGVRGGRSERGPNPK